MNSIENYLSARDKRDQKERDIKRKVSQTSKGWDKLDQGVWKSIGVTKDQTLSSRPVVSILRYGDLMSLEELADLIEEWRDAGRAVSQAYNTLCDTERGLVDAGAR